jgi:hypothetical protein
MRRKHLKKQVEPVHTRRETNTNDLEPARITEIPEEPVPRRSPSPVELAHEPAVVTKDNHPREQAPEHPYRNAKDATYAPPRMRNVGAPVKPVQPVAKKAEPAYSTLPAIHDSSIANSVYKRALEAPVTITH